MLVRDHSGRILWAGHLAKGGHQQLFGIGPFTVRAGKPAAVDVWVAGKVRGPWAPASRRCGARSGKAGSAPAAPYRELATMTRPTGHCCARAPSGPRR